MYVCMYVCTSAWRAFWVAHCSGLFGFEHPSHNALRVNGAV